MPWLTFTHYQNNLQASWSRITNHRKNHHTLHTSGLLKLHVSRGVHRCMYTHRCPHIFAMWRWKMKFTICNTCVPLALSLSRTYWKCVNHFTLLSSRGRMSVQKSKSSVRVTKAKEYFPTRKENDGASDAMLQQLWHHGRKRQSLCFSFATDLKIQQYGYVSVLPAVLAPVMRPTLEAEWLQAPNLLLLCSAGQLLTCCGTPIKQYTSNFVQTSVRYQRRC